MLYYLHPTINPDEGTADLVLDIDYILKWEKVESGFRFTVCKAKLTFHGVFGLKFSLDYATPTAGMSPFTIDRIEREPFERFGFKSFRWRIPINWPVGAIEFEAQGFTQTLMGEPIVQSSQGLPE